MRMERYISMARKSAAKRPLLISIIGWFYMIVGIITLLSSIALFLNLGAIDLGIEGGVEIIGGGGVVLALILIVIGKAFLDGWTIAWYLGVILMGLGLIGGLFALPAGLVGTVVAAVVLYYLFRPGVKSFFKV